MSTNDSENHYMTAYDEAMEEVNRLQEKIEEQRLQIEELEGLNEALRGDKDDLEEALEEEERVSFSCKRHVEALKKQVCSTLNSLTRDRAAAHNLREYVEENTTNGAVLVHAGLRRRLLALTAESDALE